MTSIANGRGLMVSRLPLGICNTKLIVLGTAVTIRDPLSTFRLSHPDIMPLTSPLSAEGTAEANLDRDANMTSCALVVKIRKPEEMVNEVTFDSKTRTGGRSPIRYSLPDAARPT